MKSLRYIWVSLLLVTLACAATAGQKYQLYVNGVLYKAPSILEKGLPYFPVDILSEATGVPIVSFSNSSIRLAGSPVDFVPVVREGRPYLPAEAFAMASGSGVETDQTRGLVMYSGEAPSGASTAASGSGDFQAADGSANSGGGQYAPAQQYRPGPGAANPGVQSGDPGPPPVAAPPTAVAPATRNTEGLQEAVVGAMKTAQEITYANRWLKHKMYWVNQLDPANSPYLRVNLPPGAISPTFAPHPWSR